MDREQRTAVNRLSRGDIEAILNWGGFATYDSESTDDLREALRQAIECGDIDFACIEVQS